MSIGEFHGWAKYLNLEPHNGVEVQTALVAQVANNAMGGKAKLKDMLITSYDSNKKETVEDMVAQRPDDNAVLFAFSVLEQH